MKSIVKPEETNDYVGLTEESAHRLAQSNDHRIRTMFRDRETFCGTMDLGPDRINLRVREGVVINAWIG